MNVKKTANGAKSDDSFVPLSHGLLEKRIGYTFAKSELLESALTHSSFANESKERKSRRDNNERLEFLGDAVLSVIVAEYIFLKFSDYNEGILTKVRAKLVCEDTLNGFANEIGLGKYMYLGHGEILTHGRNRKSILADAFEALIAAIFLDGGMEKAKAFVLPFIEENELDAFASTEDFKSRLQKIVQQTPEETLEYKVKSEEGPPHDRRFVVCVFLNSNLLGEGAGHSKREAEQLAAREALLNLGETV